MEASSVLLICRHAVSLALMLNFTPGITSVLSLVTPIKISRPTPQDDLLPLVFSQLSYNLPSTSWQTQSFTQLSLPPRSLTHFVAVGGISLFCRVVFSVLVYVAEYRGAHYQRSHPVLYPCNIPAVNSTLLFHSYSIIISPRFLQDSRNPCNFVTATYS